MNTYTLKIISDFNVKPLENYLNNFNKKKNLFAETSQYGNIFNNLSKLEKKNKYSGLLFWTSPEKMISEFARSLEMYSVNEKKCFEEVDFICDILKNLSKHNQIFFVKWSVEHDLRGYGLLEWKSNIGIRILLTKINLYFAEKLKTYNNIYILDFDKIIFSESENFSRKLWYVAKIPYNDKVFLKASNEILSAIEAIKGKNKKIIIVDCDNTLWGGLVGECGWKKIRLGGHDYIGEAFKNFQFYLKALSNSGIQLAICSKNQENVVMDVFRNHNEMILKKEDFISFKINWQSKSENIKNLLKEVNLVASSAVFIDDNPVERENVKLALPEILIPYWDDDPTKSVDRLNNLKCFNYSSFTNEDRNRKKMYLTEAKRVKIKHKSKSEDVWLKKIQTKVKVRSVNSENITRTIQLLNKTNQLNLTTRRFTENTFKKNFFKKPNNLIKVIYVSDKFGDLGLVGIIGLSFKDDKSIITDYVLSCRAMGRKIEDLMFYLAIKYSKTNGAKLIEAKYIKTKKNIPTLEIFNKSKLNQKKKNHFFSKKFSEFKKPKFISIKCLQ